MITKASIENLKTSIDIVDVVSSYISLKKAGVNYKACCPFHDEQTPSFVVSSAKGIYHCFGCSASGDSISFVMEYEKLNYVEALEKLASNYGVTLEYDSKTSSSKLDFSVIESVNDFYIQQLKKSNQLMAYLVDRGLSTQSIEKFKLGYASSSNDTIKFLKDNFFNLEVALDFGIVSQDDSSNLYARFINRITFPIYSNASKLIGFGGRTLSDGDNIAKYLNSPTTKFFNKSRVLYGYDLAKQSIYKQKEIIICEGYLDVIMLHQAGFNNAVATLGTALTKEHLPLISKSEAFVILAYDGDKAGINAAFKAAKLLSINKIEGGVVIFKDGLDPADMIKENKIEELNKIFSHPKNLIEFVIDSIASHFDLNNANQKEKAIIEVKNYLNSLGEIIAESFINYVASIFKIDPKLIKLKKNVAFTLKSNLTKEDLAELNLIKTYIEVDEFKDLIESYSNQGIFKHYKDLFELAKINDKNNPIIAKILLDEAIKVYSKDELIKQLQTLLIPTYQEQLSQIKQDNSIDFRKKAKIIRDLQEKIRQLKNI